MRKMQEDGKIQEKPPTKGRAAGAKVAEEKGSEMGKRAKEKKKSTI